MADMKVVITGGSGLLGQQVVSELVEHGYRVLSLDRKPHPRAYRPAWIVDLADAGSIYEACADAHAVVHLAAHIAPNLTSDCATFNDNVTLTYNLMKAAFDCGVRRAAIASSIAAYGFLYGLADAAPDYLPIDEDHPCRPIDPYGLSKVTGEIIADSFASRGMSIVSLRLPGINYDPSYERLKGFFADPAHRRSGFWSYVDVRDAAVACRLAIEAPVTGHRRLNIAAPTSNMREPTRELIQRFFPGLEDIRGDRQGNWSGLDCRRAEQELGFGAQHSWERYLGD